MQTGLEVAGIVKDNYYSTSLYTIPSHGPNGAVSEAGVMVMLLPIEKVVHQLSDMSSSCYMSRILRFSVSVYLTSSIWTSGENSSSFSLVKYVAEL